MKIPTTETTQGDGGGLRAAGTFHCVVNEVQEGESRKGKAIDGLTVTFEVLDGTITGQSGKTHSECFFLPTMQDDEKKSGMKLRKLTALAIAGSVLTPDQLGTEIDIPFDAMVGNQMMVKFDHQMEMDGNGAYTVESKYIQVAYSDLFHVDDPAVVGMPQNAEAIGLIPKEQRHDASWFAWKKRTKTHRQAVGQANGKQAAMASKTDADDIF